MISAVLPPPLKPRLIFFPFSTWAVPRQGVVLPAGLLIMHNCYTSALSMHILLNMKSFAIYSKCIRNREEYLIFLPKSRQILETGYLVPLVSRAAVWWFHKFINPKVHKTMAESLQACKEPLVYLFDQFDHLAASTYFINTFNCNSLRQEWFHTGKGLVSEKNWCTHATKHARPPL